MSPAEAGGIPAEAEGIPAEGIPAEASAPEPTSVAPAQDAANHDPWIGRVVAERYRVISRLGEGGMAVVYEAESLAIKKRVALKLAHPSVHHSGEIGARFLREIEASARIDHPHVAQAFDAGTLPSGEAFLVTQLVRGESLASRLARGPIPWAEAAAIATQLADALSAIHAAGFVHRDLTPSNVLLASGQRVQGLGGAPHVFVLDLGIAAIVEEKSGRPPTAPYLTLKGTTVGTPGYMSPEQAVGRPVDGRSDLHALGLVFFEMVQGQRVVEDASLSAQATRLLAEELRLPDPSTMPAALFAHARSLLRAEAKQRPADAATARAGFAPFANGEPPPLGAVVRGATHRSLEGVRARWSRERPRIVAALSAFGTEISDGARRLREGRSTVRDRWLAGVAVAIVTSTFVLVLLIASALSPDPPPVTMAPPPPVVAALPVGVPEPEAPAVTEVEVALLSGRTRAVREEAAGVILSAEDGAYPRYARLVSVLTLARTCDARRAQIEAIGALGDPRALPALQRIADAPRTGCGRRSREDCYACVRDAVAAALAQLGS